MAAKKRLLDDPILTFFITPLFFWVSAFLCRTYSPNAAGHHLQSAINQLKKDPDNFKAAFLSVILGEPITAAIIVFETTGQNIKALPFLIGATLISLMIWKMAEKKSKQSLYYYSACK